MSRSENGNESSLVASFRKLIDDQEIKLRQLREDRRNAYERIAEMDAEEIEILLSISRMKEIINEEERI